MKAGESNDISLKTEEIEDTNEPSQVSAAVMPDEVQSHQALSDGAGECEAILKDWIYTIIHPTATDSDGIDIEDSRMAHHLSDTTSSSPRSYDDGASPWATAASALSDSSSEENHRA